MRFQMLIMKIIKLLTNIIMITIIVIICTWKSTSALRVSLTTILESMSSLSLCWSFQWQQQLLQWLRKRKECLIILFEYFDHFQWKSSMSDFPKTSRERKECLITLTACRFAGLPTGLGPRSTTFFNVSITLHVIFLYWITFKKRTS